MRWAQAVIPTRRRRHRPLPHRPCCSPEPHSHGTRPTSLAYMEDSTGATTYNVKWAATNGGPYITVAPPAGATYTDTTVTNGTTYYYVVTAVNAVGEGANSNQARRRPVQRRQGPLPVVCLSARLIQQATPMLWAMELPRAVPRAHLQRPLPPAAWSFNCGPSPYKLALTSTQSITQGSVIDGGNLVTLDC
jgi:hypothetical protein